MIPQVPDRPLSPDDLAVLLERLNVQPVGGKLPREVVDAQVGHFLARLTELTGVLRGVGSDGTTRLAARLLVADLSIVAGQLRGRTNEMAASLTRALEDTQCGLGHSDRQRESHNTDRPRVR